MAKVIKKDENFNDILNYSLSEDLPMLRNYDYKRNNEQYSQWEPWSFRVWHDGVNKKI